MLSPPATPRRPGRESEAFSRQRTALTLQKWGAMAQFRARPRLGRALFRLALALDPSLKRARREIRMARPRGPDDIPHMRALIFGTSGTCNASCVHCPTGKPSTAHAPRGTMSMELFRKIVDGVADEGLALTHVGFGLFGDGLVDPLVVERARYLRETLPDAPLAVNTNGAAYNSVRHAQLYAYVSALTVHCESLRPDVYDRLMTPLRAKNVFPKYQAMLNDFPGKLRVSIPVSRVNRDELVDIREWFLERGAEHVSFVAMSNRCMTDASPFDTLALAPVRIRCGPEIVRDLIVDCDGAVLACCNDFAREHPIGNLATESFSETMSNLARRDFAEKMGKRQHDAIALCARCRADLQTPDFPFDVALAQR